MITEISSLTIGGIGIVLGLSVGWLLAKGKAKKYENYLNEELKENISEEEIIKQKKEDEEFWKLKGGINGTRKQKYRTTRANGYEEINGKSNTGQSGEGRRIEQSEDIDSSIKRESVSDIAPKLIEKHSTESDADSKTNEQCIFVPERLE